MECFLRGLHPEAPNGAIACSHERKFVELPLVAKERGGRVRKASWWVGHTIPIVWPTDSSAEASAKALAEVEAPWAKVEGSKREISERLTYR